MKDNEYHLGKSGEEANQIPQFPFVDFMHAFEYLPVSGEVFPSMDFANHFNAHFGGNVDGKTMLTSMFEIGAIELGKLQGISPGKKTIPVNNSLLKQFRRQLLRYLIRAEYVDIDQIRSSNIRALSSISGVGEYRAGWLKAAFEPQKHQE